MCAGDDTPSPWGRGPGWASLLLTPETYICNFSSLHRYGFLNSRKVRILLHRTFRCRPALRQKIASMPPAKNTTQLNETLNWLRHAEAIMLNCKPKHQLGVALS